MTWRRVALVSLVLIGLGTSTLMCSRVAERGRYATPYSTYGAGPEGVRALFELAELRGMDPQRHIEDVGELPPGAMLFALGGCEAPLRRELSRYERQSVGEWIEAGGVLVVAGSHEYLGEDFGVSLARPEEACVPDRGLTGVMARATKQQSEQGDAGTPNELEEIPAQLRDDPRGTLDAMFEQDEHPPRWANPAPGLLEGIGAVPMRRPGHIRVDAGVEAETLLTYADLPVAVRVRRGRGSIVVVASASPFTNQEVAASQGAPLFRRLVDELAPRGPVLFDEFHLGVGGTRSFVRYAREVGGGALALQLLLVVGLLLWRRGARIGAPTVRAPEVPAGTASYVDAIGTIYRRSKDDEGAARILARHALVGIAKHHHVQSSEPLALAKMLAERGRDDAAVAVRQLSELTQDQTSKFKLVERARRIDALFATATREEPTS